jgi:hypothetical protein
LAARRKARPSAFRLLLSSFSLFLLPACSHYRLGTGAEPKFSTLHVAPVAVEAMLPQAQAVIGGAIREAFDRDGRVRLAGKPEAADAVLTVTIVGYDREVATVRADDTGRARRFDISLRARATLTDRRSGQPLFADRLFTAKRGVFTDSGQQQSEYENLPLLAQDLARQLLGGALDTW